MNASNLIPSRWRLAAAALLTLGACSDDDGNPGNGDPDAQDIDAGPLDGQTSFVSAAGRAGEATPDTESDAGAAEDGGGGDGGGDRTVEEGDIYRVLGEGRLLNLNYFRGVQVIDYSDLSNPQVIGRLPVVGSPVEMYVVGDVAYVLLNNWEGYYGSRADVRAERQQGGLVMAVDLSDPTAPREIARSVVPGWIQTSRVAREGETAALYVAANWWGPWETADGAVSYDSRTVVKSFDLTGGGLEDRTSIDLGGYVTAVQATPQALLVARYDWNYSGDAGSETRSLVSLVDISSIEGDMVEGDQVPVAGYVQNKTNLDLYNDVLRVVSTGAWAGTNTNHLQTFDATDINDLLELDDETFGDGMQLFATIFLGNKAFFVTYFRMDPLHAFEITDEGDATEISEFEISGWNSYFRPVFNQSRMIGIGSDDADGSATLAVSLYDITELANPNPFIARAEVEADSSWSEASWDDRAFSVVEDAVEIEAEDGTVETGLVLLPFSGWDEGEQTYQSSVQIYTFSENTLTRRGLMDHGTQVRRSFVAEEDVTANLSEQELSLFDTSNPEEPVEEGRLELAPNFADIQFMGDYAVRIRDRADWYSWWGSRTERPGAVLEVLNADAPNLDAAAPIATVEIPNGGTVLRSGDLLVSVSQFYEWSDDGDYNNDYRTRLSVVDMSEPTAPVLAGSVESTDVRPYQYWGYGWAEDCWNCGGVWYGDTSRSIFPTDGAITFLQAEQQQESLGMVTSCSRELNYTEVGCTNPDGSGAPAEECIYRSGGMYCQTFPDGTVTCEGGYQECTRTLVAVPDGEDSGDEWYYDYDCVPYTPNPSEITEYCNEYERFRYWQSFSLVPIVLQNPAAPVVGSRIELGQELQGVGAIYDGNRIFVNYVVPTTVEGDTRPYVRYFVRILDMSNPVAPVLGEPINVPGQVMAASGNTIYTRDTVWGTSIVETAVARLAINNNLAYLQGWFQFPNQQVDTIVLDGAGHLLASHRLSWSIPTTDEQRRQQLTILDATSLQQQGQVEIDDWASLNRAIGGRALFNVPGGMLVVNTEDATNPFAQAWFPTRWWSSAMTVRDNRLIFAAGPFGIFEFDLDEFNLLAPM